MLLFLGDVVVVGKTHASLPIIALPLKRERK